jgi:cytochrome c556
MKHIIIAVAAILLAACGPGDKNASAAPEAAALPATSHAKDIIAARRELMMRMGELIVPIDALQKVEQTDHHMLREHAELIASMLAATPHLFPPDTNLYDAAATDPATLAMPAIWQNFDAFYAMASVSATAAREFAKAEGTDAQLKTGAALRATCEACHAQYLRPYKPAAPEASDAEFDFDTALN